MANVETEAIVLRNYNLSDADKIVVFITKEHGLIKGVAKGAKRLKSKFGSSLEPFSVVTLTFLHKAERELNTIRQIDLLNSYFKSTSQIGFLNKFEYFAELLIYFVPPNDANQRVYGMTKVCLETASKNPDTLEQIALYFEIWLLKLSGFLPNWQTCSKCKRDLNTNDLASLQVDSQLLCSLCENYNGSGKITSNLRELYNYAQLTSPDRFIKKAGEYKTDTRELSSFVKQIISKVLGREKVGEKIFTAKLN